MKYNLLNTLQKKIMIIFSVLLIVIVSMYATITYNYDSRSIYDQVAEANLLTLEQMNNAMNTQIMNLDRISYHLSLDSTIHETLRENSLDGEQPVITANKELGKLLDSTLKVWPEVENITIYSLDHDWLSAKESKVVLPYPRLEDYKNTRIKVDYGTLINSQKDSNSFVVSYLRLIEDPVAREPLGWVRLDQNLYNVPFLQKLENDNRMFTVLESNGKVIFTNKPNQSDIVVHTRILRMDQDKSSFFTKNMNEKSLVNFHKSDHINWIFISIVPKKMLNEGLIHVRNFTLSLITLVIIVSFFASNLLSRWITNPLKALFKSIEKVKQGDIKIRVPVLSGDEIGEVGKQLNTMLDSIEHLIQHNYQMELDYRYYELKALRTQINPHFMYNTLEFIDIYALKGQKEQVHQIIQPLSSMMRYAFTSGKLASLEQELRNVSDYLQIQEVRYLDNLKVKMAVPEHHLKESLPPLSLQPLIENTFKYGFFRKKIPNYLMIYTEECGQTLKINICDNGVGASSETVEDIIKQLEKRNEEVSEHIGLYNVHRRIQWSFGENFGLHVYSLEGHWFKSVITIPLNEGKQGGEESWLIESES